MEVNVKTAGNRLTKFDTKAAYAIRSFSGIYFSIFHPLIKKSVELVI